MDDDSKKIKVLIVDDVPANIRVLIQALISDYEIGVATNGLEALEIVHSQDPPDLILLDIMMPEMDGYEVCRRLKADEKTRDIPVIFITARSEEDDETKGLALEAVDYITKPFCLSIVKARVRTHLELKRHRDHLDVLVKERTDELIQANQALKISWEKLRRTLEQTVSALTATVEMKDPYTSGHQQRVKQLACAIAEKMDLSEDSISGVRIAALLHDIGKISIPSEILSKPGGLNDPEFCLLKEHPKIGYEILKGIEFPRPIAQIVMQHHEKINGSGYPRGLKEEDILLEAKILCVADVVEAMSSHRPYRPTLGIDKALEEVFQNSGVLYDPEVVRICMQLFNEDDFSFSYR